MMVLMTVLTTVIIGTAVFRISKRTIEKNYQSAHIHNLEVSSKMMDIYLQTIVEEGRTLLEDDSFIRPMETDTNETGYFSSRNQIVIDKALGNILSIDNFINGMLVVNENGNWRYYAKSKVYSGYLNHYYTTDEILEEDWVQTARDAQGKEVFYPYDVLLKSTDKEDFCMVKNLINPHTQKSFGFLVISIDMKIWEESFGKDTEGYETNRYMIISSKSKSQEEPSIVYFTGKKEEMLL
jgi:hypothetical protein